MRRGWLAFLVALVVVPRAAWAQGGPLGPQFRVNTYTTSRQETPAIAIDAAGNFVVVWRSYLQDGSDHGVFGQRYDSSGTPLGAEFQVNTYTTGAQFFESVASDAAGNFVVVWNSPLQDGSGRGVFGQRYDSSGTPLGAEFRVNTFTTGHQSGPSVAATATGDFVVVWDSYQDGSSGGVFGRRYASSGGPLGPEFRVNTYTTGFQGGPHVAANPSGNFVVVWVSYGQDGSLSGMFGQRYASSGDPLGPEFQLNTYTTHRQTLASVASDASGDFVVAWTSYDQDGTYFGVFGRRYANSGSRLGPEFRVNTFTPGLQELPSVASDAAGNFVVVWMGDVPPGADQDISGQRYAASGSPLGPEFRVNTYTTQFQRDPAVASDPFGRFVVAWSGNGQDGSSWGVFGQRFGQMGGDSLSFAQAGSSVAETSGDAAIDVVLTTPDGQPSVGASTVVGRGWVRSSTTTPGPS